MRTGRVNATYRSAVGLALATPLLLVWMIGAVGVLGRAAHLGPFVLHQRAVFVGIVFVEQLAVDGQMNGITDCVPSFF